VKRQDETVATVKMEDEYERIQCFTLLPGDRAAVGTIYGLYLLDPSTGKQVRKFQGHTGVVCAVSPSPDTRYLLSSSYDQTLRLLLDGWPYQGQAGVKNIVRDQSEDQREVRASWTVSLTPGKHRLAAQAESDVSKALSDEVEVIYAEPGAEATPDLPTLYVLA